MKADPLGKYLGINYATRHQLGIRTIGARDVTKRARTLLRKRKDKATKAAKRRANGARPHSESRTATKPWRALGMSRRTWYRRRRGTVGTDSSTIDLRISATDLCHVESQRGDFRAGLRPEERKEDFRLATATIVAAYESMPVHFRLKALGLCLK
jgi:hypothetical protein